MGCGASRESLPGLRQGRCEWLTVPCKTSRQGCKAGRNALVHESKVDGTECAEQIDIFKEFFDGHPNSCALAREFVAMRLAPDMVERQSANIRMASYRWQDVMGVGTNGCVAI